MSHFLAILHGEKVLQCRWHNIANIYVNVQVYKSETSQGHEYKTNSEVGRYF